MSAPVDWLTGPLPPSPAPREETNPIYDGLLSDMERTSVLYRVEELNRMLNETPQANDGTIPEMPRVVRVGSWRWFKRNWNAKRAIGGGSSLAVLVVTALGWWKQ